MAINQAPASIELTAHDTIRNRAVERFNLARAIVRYQRNGGLIGVYAAGAAWDKPSAARGMVGRKKVMGDVADYLAPIKARLEAKAAAKRRQHEERLARAASLSAPSEFDAQEWIDSHRFARASV